MLSERNWVAPQYLFQDLGGFSMNLNRPHDSMLHEFIRLENVPAQDEVFAPFDDLSLDEVHLPAKDGPQLPLHRRQIVPAAGAD